MSDSAQPGACGARFAEFAALCERLAAIGSRLERTRQVADFLRQHSPQAAEIATRWLVGRAFPEAQGRRLALSGRAVLDALAQIGADITGARWAGAEDFGELVRQTMTHPAAAAAQLSFDDITATFTAIAAAAGGGSRRQRITLLAELLRRATPLEAKYITKIVIGEMRHGVHEGIVLDAFAALAGADTAGVRRAHQAMGDIGRLARLVKTEGTAGLGTVAVQLFRPIKPMLAQTAADVAAAFTELQGRLALEWKLDGARVQIHKQGAHVRLFSRRLHDITTSLPDVAARVARSARARNAIFEGEVIPVADGRPLPFQELMRRFRRIRNVSETAAQVPVQLYLFDVLLYEQQLLLDTPSSARWDTLQQARGDLDCVGRLVPADGAAGQRFYQAAIAAGYEGVMAKALDAGYTPGARGKGWLKIKKIVTLDLVVIAADWGYGRRHGWLSNYHLAARDAATGQFVAVGKTFKGLTDAEFQAMTERLLQLKTGETHGTVYVRPEVVVEVRFTDIQKSPHYPCGMALRFARIFRIRDDKSAGEADTLDTLTALFRRGNA
jgi:DNA ligase-1